MTVPDGLSLTLNFISPEKEQEIISWLDTQNWSNDISRRTQHYGYNYGYKSKNLVPGQPLIGPILDISNMIEKYELIKPVQCIVNEYYRDQGITPHIDAKMFGPTIIGVSIGADVTMIFERGTEKFECFLPRRSIMMMTGQARYEWKHSIEKRVTYIDNIGQKVTKPKDYRRISLTYRELS